MINSPPLQTKINKAFEFAAQQLHYVLQKYPNQFPIYTQNGRWICQDHTGTHWTEGFIGGQLWLVFLETHDKWFLTKAQHYSKMVEHRKTDISVHDLGFIFWPTWKRWFDWSGADEHNRVVIEAGRTLARRFHEPGHYLYSFRGLNSLYIDIMMNVGLVFYAAQQEHNPQLLDIAYQHCLTTRRWLVHGDGSTAHEGIFDPISGQFLYQSTRQGWRADSCWARGLAWALYGFGTAFQFTQDFRYLQTASLLADYYLEHTPLGTIPPNDLDEPSPRFRYESSAGAIAASGLVQLAQLTQNTEAAAKYFQAALTTIEVLLSSDFFCLETPGWEGLIKHGIYHIPENAGVDESLIWGDYYFLEALSRISNDLHNVDSSPMR